MHNICITRNDIHDFDDLQENEQDDEEEQADRGNAFVDSAADKPNEKVDFCIALIEYYKLRLLQTDCKLVNVIV